MDINVNIPALEKLCDYAASGIGSIAGPILAPWKARREAQVKKIVAKAEADALVVLAEAQAEARKTLISQDSTFTAELDIANTVSQRIQFQEEKRQKNIESVVKQAASQLGDKEVPDNEPDHDWTARFFNEAQDVSSEEMQSLWAKVLAGEVERAGSTSIRTLSILKNLDQATAHLLRKFCSACIFFCPDGKTILDARVPSLGGNAATNALQAYGFDFGNLNILNEHGLIISDYNSWRDYKMSIGVTLDSNSSLLRIPFIFQNRHWILVPTDQGRDNKEYRLSGVALTHSGCELARIVELESMDKFAQDLINYFQKSNFQMTEIDSQGPQLFRYSA